jgi:hypothetical protein
VLIADRGGLAGSAALVGGMETWTAIGKPLETGIPDVN